MPVSKENKVTLWLIALCLLFGIHFNFENTGGTGLEVPYNNFTWMFVCLILSSGLWHIAKHQQWKKDTSLYLIGFIILAMIIPILFQEFHAPSSAGLRVLGITTGLLITLLSVQNFRSQSIWNTFLYILAGAGALEATLCLIQQYLPDVAAYGVYKPDYGRPFGSFQQPNVSATFIATGLSAALYLVITKHTSTPSSNPQASSPSVKKSLEYLLPK